MGNKSGAPGGDDPSTSMLVEFLILLVEFPLLNDTLW